MEYLFFLIPIPIILVIILNLVVKKDEFTEDELKEDVTSWWP